MITFGNSSYCLMLLVVIYIICLTHSILVAQTKQTQKLCLFILVIVNFLLHFAKQFVYADPAALHKSTAENICAISTLLLPILFTSKQNFMTDFIYFISILGGAAAILYPTEALNRTILEFETLRFYFCHLVLFMTPILLSVFDIYRPSMKSLRLIPVGFLIYQCIICANTAILCFSNIEVKQGFTALELFLDNRYLNNSFTFGPTEDMGFFSAAIDFLIPNFMKFNFNGRVAYWPVACLIIPSFIIMIPLYVVICLLLADKEQNKCKLKR